MGKRRIYGTGGLWLRKSKRHPKGVYWIRFYDAAGRQRAENTKTDSESKALKKLALRTGQVEAGNLPSPKAARTLVCDLAEALFKVQRASKLRKIPENLPEPTREWRAVCAERVIKESRLRWDKHLQPVFGERKAALVTKQDFDEYIAARLAAKARNATINRELSLLHRMFRLGYEQRPRLVPDIPQFPAKLPETARTGYVDDADFQKVLAAIKQPGLRALVLVAYRLGFRKAELQNLLVLQVAGGWIQLFAGATKNGKARRVAMPDDVRAAVELCCNGKAPDDHVFTWPGGRRILDFRAAWAKATAAAKVPGLLFHDLRRSAARRMVRAGLPVATAMRITGHLTRQVFDSYDVSGDADLLEAARKL